MTAMMDRLPELLAPAGSMDALRAAVNAGADAVYLGGKKFGARTFASNFTDEELAAAIGYAHLWGVRVYVTVNTLVHDRELPALARYLVMLYGMGADAILLQDAGGAALARELVPDLPRHASTQCTITDREGVIRHTTSGSGGWSSPGNSAWQRSIPCSRFLNQNAPASRYLCMGRSAMPTPASVSSHRSSGGGVEIGVCAPSRAGSPTHW